MFKVLEVFSGIGSQAKALKRLNIGHEIVATIEWDISAFYAYDIIHNGNQNLELLSGLCRRDLVEKLNQYTLSNNGKEQIKPKALKNYSVDSLRRILYAIERTKNLLSIKDIASSDLPENIDLLTYSFPCQDLSISGRWHGNLSGINRNSNNRSSMLWEVERLLIELSESNQKTPRYLLMENVSNILSNLHLQNFEEWKDYLKGLGYINQVYTLNAVNFGIPHKRNRTFMISVLANGEDIGERIVEFFEKNNLENFKSQRDISLIEYLRTDYSHNRYSREADMCNPNDTPSRLKIYENNILLFDGEKVVSPFINTITTKQDRNPNSGVILYPQHKLSKAKYRNLTPRECFLLMGFDEADFDMLMSNDFMINRKVNFFTREKLTRLAGNSIVVNVLEEIFKQIFLIENTIICTHPNQI